MRCIAGFQVQRDWVRVPKLWPWQHKTHITREHIELYKSPKFGVYRIKGLTIAGIYTSSVKNSVALSMASHEGSYIDMINNIIPDCAVRIMSKLKNESRRNWGGSCWKVFFCVNFRLIGASGLNCSLMKRTKLTYIDFLKSKETLKGLDNLFKSQKANFLTRLDNWLKTFIFYHVRRSQGE